MEVIVTEIGGLAEPRAPRQACCCHISVGPAGWSGAPGPRTLPASTKLGVPHRSASLKRLELLDSRSAPALQWRAARAALWGTPPSAFVSPASARPAAELPERACAPEAFAKAVRASRPGFRVLGMRFGARHTSHY